MKSTIIILFSMLLIACSENNIYYDLEHRSIVSCDGSKISRYLVEEVGEGNKVFLFNLQNQATSADIVNIENPKQSFNITELPFEKIEKNKFKLKPLTKYKITNLSNGDAAKCSIIISTDRSGHILKANKTSCR